ncbi:MAG TPA: transcription initiation factor IIB [Nitrososphaeraceae archaeon]|nr:transcription initiation factor IIB [Nitrososphaeraceae archaeon]
MSKLVEKLQKPDTAKDICFNCKNSNLVFDSLSSEIICTNCGVVNCEQFITDHISVDRSQNLEKNSLLIYDKGLSTTISQENVDAYGNQLNVRQISKAVKIRHWNKISNSNRSYHRNLKKAFSILMRIKDKLSLSETIIEKSAYYYRKVVDLKIIKGRSIKEFIVACVYVVCRELKVPRTIGEIANSVNADKVFAGRCYRLILRHLMINLPLIDSTTHMTKIAGIAGITRQTMVRALEMMTLINDDPISYGKDPTALSVATLYGACLEKGEKITQSKIANAGNMSVVTLRKRFLDVKQIFPHLPENAVSKNE